MGRHRRPEADALDGIDVAADLESGPVIDTSAAPRHEIPAQDAGSDGAAPLPPVAAEVPAATVVPSGRAVTVVGSTVVARRDRKAEREARRTAARRRLLVICAAALAALLVIGVTAVIVSSAGGDDPVTAAPAKPKQSTLVVLAAGQDGTAAASALLGVTQANGKGAALLIPAGLLVDVASSGSLPFGETLTLPSKQAPAEALTDLLHVNVSNTWALSLQGLAALVDKVGGVQVTVDVDVITKDAKGNQAVVVRAGSQKLSGAQAAAYATYLADGEPETVRLARFNDVLDEVLRSLPASRAGIATVLTGLSTGSTSTITPSQLAGLLITARTAAIKEQLHYDVLPVNDIDTGDTVDTYGVDSSKAGTLLQSMFGPSLQKDPTGDTVRVLVENGVGTPDLVEKARTKLVRDGFRFINGGNSSGLSATDPTVVLIQDGSQKAQARGARVAKSLGLPASAIQINPRGQTVADIIVVLGADFRP
jgi:anionic cell wall polymer biosynthesis LytR-Cps2A-Psr (LCP) family protein